MRGVYILKLRKIFTFWGRHTTMVPMGWNIWRQISPHYTNGVKFGAKYFTPLVPWWWCRSCGAKNVKIAP